MSGRMKAILIFVGMIALITTGMSITLIATGYEKDAIDVLNGGAMIGVVSFVVSLFLEVLI